MNIKQKILTGQESSELKTSLFHCYDVNDSDTSDNLQKKSVDSGSYVWHDFFIKLDESLSQDKDYYFSYNIINKYIGGSATVNIKLYNYSSGGNEQYIKTITIPVAYYTDSTDKTTLQQQEYPDSFVVTPLMEGFNAILFEVSRSSLDIVTGTSSSNAGREISPTLLAKSELVPVTFDNTTGSAIKKMGVQGKPGTQLVVNGENIKIGYNGIFEMINDIEIERLSIYNTDTSNQIIIDYQY